jgi:hypothetical protein
MLLAQSAPRTKGGITVDEQTIVTAIAEISSTLRTMALVSIHPEDPLALPEPPEADEAAVYEGHINALKAQVDPSYHNLLTMSLRDYRGGFPDRAGAYLIEFLEKFSQEPNYSQNFSAAAQSKMNFSLSDLREL